MGVEGIGASVVRKEDKRFITGKGRFVDDIKLIGMSYAHFVRSPHAHAKVKGIDVAAAMKMPGVMAVLTGRQLVDDLLSGQHRDDARHFHRRRGIDALDLGVGVRTADEMGIGHADQLDVVDVTALACDETLVFLAHHACANAFNAHVLSSLPEMLMSRRFHRSPAVLN